MNFKYTVALSEHLPFGDGKKPLETHTGIIEAKDYSDAKEKAWGPIVERGKQIQTQQGIIVAYGNVQIALTNEQESMSAEQIISLIRQKLVEAENNSNIAFEWHAKVILEPLQRKEAFAHVAKAATQATLLQSLLDQIDGKSVVSLWEQ
jgi:hypothetical protein